MPPGKKTDPVYPTPPTRRTLSRYRLTEALWLQIVKRQAGLCPVCSQPLAGGRMLAIDHAHVKGFKRMKPEERRLHVRGVLHSFCNRYVRGWLTVTRARAILAYLEAHEARKTEGRAA
jgi:hypothetical protein